NTSELNSESNSMRDNRGDRMKLFDKLMLLYVLIRAIIAYVKMSLFEMPSGKTMDIRFCVDNEIEEHKEFECKDRENPSEGCSTDCLSNGVSDLKIDDRLECSNEINNVVEKEIKTEEFIVNIYDFKNDIQNEEQLKSLFEKFGEIKWAKISKQEVVTKAEETCSGDYGCVSFVNESDAKAAQREMNGHVLLSGNSMRVELRIFEAK
ncbi:hypothetical protein B4U80_12291, partial [Leptotrombidium deliense]